MSSRIQVTLSDEEHERFRRCARSRGLSLSAWMREAARERSLDTLEERFATAGDVRAFFARCDRNEEGGGSDREPEWDEHRAILDSSIGRGLAS